MARIRTIKPDFFTSEDIVSLTPLARLLFIAIWTEADREGRFVWRPKTLKLRYLPGDDCDIDELTGELLRAGLVVVYEVNAQIYAEIPTFTRHQVINNRETESTIPARVNDVTVTREARVNDATITPLMGKEGKGKEVHRTRRVLDEQLNEDFPRFWEQYPVKKSKENALKAWLKINPSPGLQALILSALEIQKVSPDWQKENGKYIPHPATWLNGHRWDDETTPPSLPNQFSNSIFAGAI